MGGDRVLLGFSGGIDSSAAVLLLREAGYDVGAVTLDMTGDRDQLCRAEAKAAELGVPWRVVDVRERFRDKVSDYFLQSYLRGETPAPCTLCNTEVKWRVLYDLAREEGVGRIATGHYCRVVESAGKYYVARAADPAKDQSYYLWGLPQPVLACALTPLGECLKSEIRERFGIPARERESMGVCFLGGRTCGEWVREQCPGILPGEIVDSRGAVIGRHDGIPFYTIGQKRGMVVLPGVRNTGTDGRDRAWCVVGIDAACNRIVAGSDDDLWRRELIVSGVYAANPQGLAAADDLEVKIRGIGRNPGGCARARWLAPHSVGVCDSFAVHGASRYSGSVPEISGDVGVSGGKEECLQIFPGEDTAGWRLRLSLSGPAWAAAAGQPVVLYREGRVVGGGFLESAG